jgi:uncharacterized protein YfeS
MNDNFHFSLQTAHPNAQALMSEEFYWSPIEETAPFGSDDGSDAAYGFKEWRFTHPASSPVSYLDDLIRSWHYPPFNLNELDSSKIKEYITHKADLDETTIRERMEMMKEINRTSQDGSVKIDDDQLREMVIQTANGMGTSYLQGMDDAIVGIGFAQFVMEGHIDKDMKALTITAMKRELLPIMLSHYVEGYRDRRKMLLTKMMEVVNKAQTQQDK